ncbi:acetyl esterase [Ochrobactrum sp. 19YEA23]|uniref:alpha/beta hydrolase n=1 Tax=Ochrobactrum sp. 19YEA23 TaxID=3039854 RepID=UPI002479CA37|nr:acetyl esterase [Ochrobactrum sp. 19YEA23]
MTGYKDRIDADTWTFINRSEAFSPQGTVTIERQRHCYDEMCRSFFAGYPDGISSSAEIIEASARKIPARIYRSENRCPAAQIIYFHGGGFAYGGLESHDDICAELCCAKGYQVLSVDYRLAPEHRFPAQYEDGFAAFEWATSNEALPTILVGDSAGGAIAAAVTHQFCSSIKAPLGQVLIYPYLGGDVKEGSYRRYAHAPMLSREDIIYYRHLLFGEEPLSQSKEFSPLLMEGYSRLPPTVAVTAQIDPVADDGRNYWKLIKDAGGPAIWREEDGLVHGYLRARSMVPRAKESFSFITNTIKSLGTRKEG